MPTRSKKPCNYPGCPELIEAGSTYCKEHKEVKADRKRLNNKRYDENRDPRLKKFYAGSRWRRLRNLYIKRNPLCEHCLTDDRVKPAEEVDHIIPVKEDWSKRFKIENLQALCRSHHRSKTIKDKELYGCS